MAEYKVPQDVEADDKLIGPFSFRQFVYLIVVALSIGAAWGLGNLFLPLAIIPLPLIIFFGALALPLRKDQPMEIFLAAMVSFYLKPRKRIWDPDGLESLIEITVPKTVEVMRSKNISQDEAHQRFSYLAEVVDSQGWAVRGVQAPNSAMNTDAYFEAQQTQDFLDSNNTVAQNLDHKLEQSDSKRREETLERIRKQAAASSVAPPASSPSGAYNYFGDSTTQPIAANDNTTTDDPNPTYNPYPDEIKQTVIQPVSSTINPTPITTSENTPSTDIMNLATNADLSIQTIAREASRLQGKSDLKEEVVISLR
ncbi:MAG TPA: PrgI family protein [Candidatus Saccharibacteria bacterium]|nr:PrgI family protein [Candidatus Saccharibacteria bacterium]HRQ07075.1 PrgI family protein [Candidatus Saccharibacteria bacterium]